MTDKSPSPPAPCTWPNCDCPPIHHQGPPMVCWRSQGQIASDGTARAPYLWNGPVGPDGPYISSGSSTQPVPSPPAPDDDGLMARLNKGEWEHSYRQGPNDTGFAQDGTLDAHLAASRITALKAENAELRDQLQYACSGRREAGDAAYARGFNDARGAAKAWHKKRAAETPDAFEMELHRVSGAAIAALKPEQG